MNKIITQFNSFVTVLAILVVISIFSTNSANAGVFDWVAGSTTKDSFSYGLSYIAPNTDADNSPTKDKEATTTQKVIRTYKVIVSAYNSIKGQTDDTPCKTATGYNVCEANVENVIAANFLPFNTKVKISGFGNRTFYVLDRMNKRYAPSPENGYTYHADIWMKNIDDARAFGRRTLEIAVIE